MSTGTAAPLLLNIFSTFTVGGPQVRFASLANRLGGAFRHAIVAMDGQYDCAARLMPDLDITYPPIEIRKGDTLSNLRAFRAALRRIRPDLMVTYNWGTIEWAMSNAIRPVVRQVHIEDGFGPEEQARQIPRRVWTRRAVLRQPTVVVPSRTLWRVATEIWRLPERRLRYLPNGIDLARFSPRSDGATADPLGPVVVGTVAALRAEKNLARLLRAVSLLSEESCKLVVVGDGPERAPLEALATELGIRGRVRFAGEVADPSTFYRSFDVFALSSDTEQMPLSVLEAMGSGLPVAATDVGDVRAMLAEENQSFVVACEDAALAGALRQLVADTGLRARIGAANRARAEREFDEQAMVEGYRRLFEAQPNP